MKSFKRHHAYILIAVVLWSTVEVIARSIVPYITPLQLTCVRFIIAALCLLPFLPGELGRKGLKLTPAVVWKAAIISIMGISAANVSYHYSLKYAGASVVATTFGITPLLTLVFAAVFLGDSFTPRKLTGVVLGIIGISVLALSRESQTFSALGLGFAILCSSCVALFTVLIKRCAGPYSGLPFATLCIAAGGVAILPLVVLEADASTLQNLQRLWVPVLYLSVATTGLSYLLFFKALEHVDATSAASSLLLKPPLATVLAAVFLSEPITWNLGAALILVLTGLYLVARIPTPMASADRLAPEPD